jgi:hypothetical protein
MMFIELLKMIFSEEEKLKRKDEEGDDDFGSDSFPTQPANGRTLLPIVSTGIIRKLTAQRCLKEDSV